MVGKKTRDPKKKRKGDIFTIAEKLGAPRGGKPLSKKEVEKIVVDMALKYDEEKQRRIKARPD